MQQKLFNLPENHNILYCTSKYSKYTRALLREVI
jgi:hypothetical protein